MKRYFLPLILALLTLTWACGSSPSEHGEDSVEESVSTPPTSTSDTYSGSASDYNNAIVGMQGEILGSLFLLTSSFGQALPDTMWAKHAKYVETVDVVIAQAEVMPDFEGNTAMRDGALGLFRFYKETAESEYKRMVELMEKPELSESEIMELAEMGGSMAEREGTLDLTFAKAQDDFARKYGLDLVENEMQEHFQPGSE